MTPLTPSFFVHNIQQNNDNHLKCPETSAELDVIETELLVDWMANNYKHFGYKLEFVTDRSREGTQFTKGFGGIGGVLRWKVEFVELTITTAIRTTTTTITGSTTVTLASKFGEFFSPTRQSHFVLNQFISTTTCVPAASFYRDCAGNIMFLSINKSYSTL